MTGIDIVKMSVPTEQVGEVDSMGVCTTITFAGKCKGRFMIDMPPELALAMVSNMSGEKMDSIKYKLFLAGIAEMNNIIAGDANTVLNNQYALGLRLAPPIVFTGKNMIVATAKMDAVFIEASTELGPIKINIAFEGGIEV